MASTVEGNYVGPLTTTFTPPASCYDLTISSSASVGYTTSYFTNSAGSSTSSSSLTTYTASYLEKFDYSLDAACYPSGRGLRPI